MSTGNIADRGLKFSSINKGAGASCQVYGGDKSHVREYIHVFGWMDVDKVNN